jgi:hypothetical protein
MTSFDLTERMINIPKRSKFNVDQSKSGKKKRTYDGKLFDSLLELNYYRYLLPQIEEGKIKSIELQPRFTLQPKFTKNGINIRKIEYIADFKITYSDDSVLIVDTKGLPDATAKLKRKRFDYCYPDLELVWIGYSKIDGGFVPIEVIDKGRKERKKAKLNNI